MRKVSVAVVCALAAVAAVAAIATAQGTVPSLAVTASPTAVSVGATGAIAPGPTQLQISRAQSRAGLSMFIGLLVPGVSLQDLQAALRRDDRTRGSQALGMVSIQSSVSFSGTQTRRTVGLTLKPGLTYVMVSEPESQGDSPPASRGFATFTTGTQGNGATAPRPDATVRMVDLRFRGSRTLPRRGVVRVQNFGGGPHIAIAFPLRAGVTSSQFGRAIRSNSQSRVGRLLAGAPVELQNVLSGGGTSNDQTVSFARSGRYGLVCFVNEHNRLGMYRVVRVR